MANGKAGAPEGNTNAKGRRTWAEAINKAVKEVDTSDPNDPKGTKKLRLLARKLVDKGIEGDVSALREIGDRLDGKSIQQLDLPPSTHITVIERVVIQQPIDKSSLSPAVAAIDAEVIKHNEPG